MVVCVSWEGNYKIHVFGCGLKPVMPGLRRCHWEVEITFCNRVTFCLRTKPTRQNDRFICNAETYLERFAHTYVYRMLWLFIPHCFSTHAMRLAALPHFLSMLLQGVEAWDKQLLGFPPGVVSDLRPLCDNRTLERSDYLGMFFLDLRYFLIRVAYWC